MTEMQGAAPPAAPFLDLAPIDRVEGVVALPGSKSISNRTLLLAALATGSTRLASLLDADDVDRMRDALAALGVGIERNAEGDCVVHGTGGAFAARSARLHLGNAGTAFRPLTAVLALSGGDYEVAGTARMHERPIGDLVDALRALGAEIRYLGRAGFPPLAIGPSRIDLHTAPTRVSVRGTVSSQFLTALLLALPLRTERTGRAVSIDIVGELISRPYVAITLSLMARFGVAVEQQDWRAFVVPGGARYASPGVLHVEGDASAASYFLAAGAIGGGPVRVTGVGRDSIQGDVAFADVLARMGADVRYGDDWIEARSGDTLRGLDVDCTAIPDAAMTLAVVALFARGPTRLAGIASWRVKETDRIDAMARELTKLGATMKATADSLVVVPPLRLQPATIDTYDDHRVAMCFSLAALGGVSVRINDPDCVRKTFPEYFAAFRTIARFRAAI
jgi:3-phosphoshikimate 1-carboxyvinyltransferase